MSQLRSRGMDGAGVLRRAWWRTGRKLRSAWQCRDLDARDVLIASYPRSGNLWLRTMLYEAIVGEATFERVMAALPYVGDHAPAPRLLNGGRLLKTHELHLPGCRRAIHLVRDPRDVVISYYSFLQRNRRVVVDQSDPAGSVFDRFVDAFINGRLAPHGTWQENARSWSAAAAAGRCDVLLVRYEDLRAEPAAGLRRILEWLGVDAADGAVERAVAGADIERMRALTRNLDAGWDRRTGNQPGRFTFVNSGRAGGWRSILTGAQAARFGAFAGSLAEFDYEPD